MSGFWQSGKKRNVALIILRNQQTYPVPPASILFQQLLHVLQVSAPFILQVASNCCSFTKRRGGGKNKKQKVCQHCPRTFMETWHRQRNQERQLLRVRRSHNSWRKNQNVPKEVTANYGTQTGWILLRCANKIDLTTRLYVVTLLQE